LLVVGVAIRVAVDLVASPAEMFSVVRAGHLQ
jgi:hypothetical protein